MSTKEDMQAMFIVEIEQREQAIERLQTEVDALDTVYGLLGFNRPVNAIETPGLVEELEEAMAVGCQWLQAAGGRSQRSWPPCQPPR